MRKKENRKQVKKKNNRFTILASIMIFMIGAGIFLYPAISNYLTTINHKNVIHTYTMKISETSKKQLDALLEEAIVYNDNLAGDPLHDPFVAGSGYVIPDNYNEVLNPNGDGVMGSIEIPKIDVNLPIYHGTSEEVLKKGAGHIEPTSLPIGGINRHSVISAHRGLPSSMLFTRLDELKIGDEFYIHVLNETHAYEIDEIKVIKPKEMSSIKSESELDLITLITCTPYGVNTHRLLVRGHRIPYTPKKLKDEVSLTSIPIWLKEYLGSILIGFLLIVLVIIYLLIRYKRKQHEK